MLNISGGERIRLEFRVEDAWPSTPVKVNFPTKKLCLCGYTWIMEKKMEITIV